MNAENTLRVLNLTCTRQHRMLFAPISFELRAGEILLIEGANGSGKTSLMRLLTGLSTPSQGEIFWENQPIPFHYVGHQNGLKLGLTVGENLRLMGLLCSPDETFFVSSGVDLLNTVIARSAVCDEAIQALALKQRQSLDCFVANSAPRNDGKAFYDADQLVHTLSAGQKRKLALLKLFLFPKKLWLLDEPLTALDATAQTIFLEKLEAHIQQGGMCIATSHQPLRLQNITAKTLRLQAC